MEVVLHPERAPYDSGFIATGDGHELYYERHGNSNAVEKVFYLHGGPGGGCSYREYRWFHPDHYDVVLFDQRWAPRSRPAPGVAPISIDLCVDDIELLRRNFGFERLNVAGGSWGAALASFYAVKYPARVRRMLLRGFFFADAAGAAYIVEADGAAARNPNRWFDAYRDFIPAAERQDGLMRPYYERLMRDDDTAMEAARLFTLWDTAIATAVPEPALIATVDDEPLENLALSRAYFYFSVHEFLDSRKAEVIAGVKNLTCPVYIIHGREDHICPVADALELHALCPSSHLDIIENCGHSMSEPALQTAFMNITERWRHDGLQPSSGEAENNC